MYWSVLGCIVAVEYVAEWLISWYALSRTARCMTSVSQQNAQGCRSITL